MTLAPNECVVRRFGSRSRRDQDHFVFRDPRQFLILHLGEDHRQRAGESDGVSRDVNTADRCVFQILKVLANVGIGLIQHKTNLVC